jgi:hypothetical protein
MARYVRIGNDVINLDAITRISFIENQSGMSDRLVVSVGDATVNIDSAQGRERMMRVREKLLAALEVENWDADPA